jgi:tRNA (cmo5U34)-methyltransferase
MKKSTVEQIRQRFDQDVERFSSLEIGQSTVVDGALMLDLVARTAAAINPKATHVLDIGCGAGNFTLTLLQYLPGLSVRLVDLSQPMLKRAVQRVSQATDGQVAAAQADIRELPLRASEFDVVLAAAVFHHVRCDAEWEAVFSKCYAALKPGGSIWISDLVEHTTPMVQRSMWQRYGEYLTELKDEEYRDHVFAYIEQEDTPRSLLFQLDLLGKVGFGAVEILHKNGCFAAFGAIKEPAL